MFVAIVLYTYDHMRSDKNNEKCVDIMFRSMDCKCKSTRRFEFRKTHENEMNESDVIKFLKIFSGLQVIIKCQQELRIAD
jgi:hypothetical protein